MAWYVYRLLDNHLLHSLTQWAASYGWPCTYAKSDRVEVSSSCELCGFYVSMSGMLERAAVSMDLAKLRTWDENLVRWVT